MFLAFGAVLLIQGFYAEHGIDRWNRCRSPVGASRRRLPAFVIHAVRIVLFQRGLRRARSRRRQPERAMLLD